MVRKNRERDGRLLRASLFVALDIFGFGQVQLFNSFKESKRLLKCLSSNPALPEVIVVLLIFQVNNFVFPLDGWVAQDVPDGTWESDGSSSIFLVLASQELDDALLLLNFLL